MKIKGWRNLFDAERLTSAMYFVEHDDVAIFCNEENHVHAIVHGQEEHVVDIHVKGQTVSSMSCDCVYAGSGCHCNHMAAVLYAVENMDLDENIDVDQFDYPDCRGWFDDGEFSEDDEERLISLLDNMSEAQLKTALYHIARKSRTERENLAVRYARRASPQLAYDVERMIDAADRPYRNPGYPRDLICDEEGYVYHVMEIIDRYIPRFIREGLLKDAFDITVVALDTVGLHFLADDAVKDRFAYFISCYLRKIFSEGDASLREYMMDKLKEIEYYDGNDVFVINAVFDFRNTCSDEKSHILSMLEERKAFLESDNADNYDEWFWDNLYDRSALFVADKLCNGYGDKSDIDGFAHKHFRSRMANLRILEYYRANGFRKEEAELLLLILSSDNLNKDFLQIHSDVELAEFESRAYGLLKELGEFEKAVDFLYKEISEKQRYHLLPESRELEKYLKPEVWKAFKFQVYMELGNSKASSNGKKMIFSFMLEEEDADVVFKTLNRCALKLEFIEAVIVKLIALDSEKAFGIHSRLLEKAMKKARGKDKYRSLVKRLSEIENIYPDGRKLAEIIAQSWKESFPEKVAMLEVLEKSGY